MNGQNGLASLQVGGNVYPLVNAPGCKTCGSEYRPEIEAALVKGYSANQVLRHLPEGHNLLERNLKDHLAAGHLPVKSAAVQKLAEATAEERGRVVEAGAEVLVTHAAFARTILSRVRERVAAGELEPDVRDGLAAARLLHDLEEPSALDHESVVRGMVHFIEAVRAIMTPGQFAELGRKIGQDPVLRTLASGRVEP